MADVQAIFGTLLALGIAFPGLLTAWWLLFPARVEAAQARVAATPGRCLALGIAAGMMAAIPIVVLVALPVAPAKLLGAFLLICLLSIAALGASGIAATMGGRLQSRSREGLSSAGAFVRGAVALELAAAFPFVGWFLFLPATLLVSLGAAIFAVLRWSPKPTRAGAADVRVAQALEGV